MSDESSGNGKGLPGPDQQFPDADAPKPASEPRPSPDRRARSQPWARHPFAINFLVLFAVGISFFSVWSIFRITNAWLHHIRAASRASHEEPTPTAAEIAAHFQKHRAVFEKLAGRLAGKGDGAIEITELPKNGSVSAVSTWTNFSNDLGADYLQELPREGVRKLTREGGRTEFVVWTPRGREIGFVYCENGAKPSAGTEVAEVDPNGKRGAVQYAPLENGWYFYIDDHRAEVPFTLEFSGSTPRPNSSAGR